MATKYIEYKHKNTGTSNCKSIRISKLQCFKNSIIKTFFRLSVDI